MGNGEEYEEPDRSSPVFWNNLTAGVISTVIIVILFAFLTSTTPPPYQVFFAESLVLVYIISIWRVGSSLKKNMQIYWDVFTPPHPSIREFMGLKILMRDLRNKAHVPNHPYDAEYR